MPKLSGSDTLPTGPVVFDASAVLAVLLDETGAAAVKRLLEGGIIGTVNVAEVLARLSDLATPLSEAQRSFHALNLDERPMTRSQARRSAEFRPLTRTAGLSFGDRACLALAAELGLPALTADRQWTKIASAVNLTIITIR